MVLYFFTFLAGIATVLSPCVLPLLPAILSAGAAKGRLRPLGIILGLIVSFAFFTLSLTYLVHLLGISANVLRYTAIAIIALFGIVMLFPYLSYRFASATGAIGSLGSDIQSHASAKKSGFWSGLLLGAALGLVWTPCAGPILAVVTTVVATQNVTWQIVLLTLTYSLGSALPLFLIAYGGQKALTAVPFLAKRSEAIKKVFGLLMLLTAAALYFNGEVYLQQVAIKYVPTIQIENSPQVRQELEKLRPPSPFSSPKVVALSQKEKGSLPKIAPAPEITGIDRWINSDPLTIAQLKGKVVLIDFWTYSCINCIRTFSYLEEWYEKYKDKGLVIIGVHTPEFEFEKDASNVKKATERFGIAYPVALDNGYKTWQAYSNQYWPAHYLIDQEGIVRQFHFGEGGYLETENGIRQLLGLAPMEKKMLEEKVFPRQLTAETYLGAAKAKSYQLDSPLKSGATISYHYTPPLRADHVALTGPWLVNEENAKSEGSDSTLELNFLATNVYLVMDSAKPEKVKVLLDGAPLPKMYFTKDINDSGEIIVSEPRKYDVLNLKEEYGRHRLLLKFPAGVKAYAFTFGDEQEL